MVLYAEMIFKTGHNCVETNENPHVIGRYQEIFEESYVIFPERVLVNV